MTLPSSRIEPSDFQTEISTGSPEFNIVRAVDMCIERAIMKSGLEFVIENARRSRRIDLCRLSAYLQVNLTEFGFSSVSESSEVKVGYENLVHSLKVGFGWR